MEQVNVLKKHSGCNEHLLLVALQLMAMGRVQLGLLLVLPQGIISYCPCCHHQPELSDKKPVAPGFLLKL